MKVTVIIPTHNRVQSLKNAIASVLDQSMKDFEIIVVSDGSTDETDDYMRILEKKDERIRYISYQPSRSGAYARNKGIEAASGDFIAFLDDDDTWLKDKLFKQTKIFEMNPDVGLVTAGIKYIYVNEKITYESIPNAEGDLSREILVSNCVGGTQAMIKKSVIQKCGGFDEQLRALQDYDLWIRVCQMAKVATLKEPTINYFNYRGSKQVSQITDNYVKSFNYISNKYSELISDLSEKEKRKRKNASYLLIANKAMRNKDKRSAYRYILKSLIAQPSLKGIAYGILASFNYEVVLKARKKFRI